MKKYLILLMIIFFPVYCIGADALKQMDEYYSGLKVGMYTVVKTTIKQPYLIQTIRTEVIKADSVEVTILIKEKSKKVTLVKKMTNEVSDSYSEMKMTYLFGKGILKKDGFSIQQGKKTPVKQVIDVSKDPKYAHVPKVNFTVPYDQKVSTPAGDFNCAVDETMDYKVCVAQNVPFGGLVKMETRQMAIELIEFSNGDKKKVLPLKEK